MAKSYVPMSTKTLFRPDGTVNPGALQTLRDKQAEGREVVVREEASGRQWSAEDIDDIIENGLDLHHVM